MMAPSAPASRLTAISELTVLVTGGPFRIPYTLPNVNDKVYIHEFIDIIGHNRVNYMHHMTANWSPIAQEERHQLCYAVWAVIGTTREWPQVVNLWEEDGFEGLSRSLDRECNNPSVQDPKLAKWWAEAAELPEPRCRPRARARPVDAHDRGAVRRRRARRRLRARAVPAAPGHVGVVPRGGPRGSRRAAREVRLGARRCVGDRDGERVGVLPALGDPDVRPVG